LKNNLSIKKWANDDKPRDKLLAKGRGSLSNAEILAIILGTGTKNKSAVGLARDVLNFCNNDLNQLAKLKVTDLCKLNGIGRAKAITIISAIELGGRRNKAVSEKYQFIRSSKDVYSYFGPMLQDKDYEEFWILLLRRNNKIIRPYKISEGGISGTVADPKRIFKFALENNASSLILCHNHPSGNTSPSNADVKLTTKISEAGKLLDIQILDHVIVTNEGYYSFADKGNI
jgi:DNA repair protein RadC